LAPSLLPHPWPCKLALTFPGLPLSFPLFNGQSQRKKKGWLGGQAPAAPPGATPLPRTGPPGSVCTVGAQCSAPHLREKSSARSSVDSGISGSPRELFSSELKRKRTICQVNRRHCSRPCRGPFLWAGPLRLVAPCAGGELT
jgi:hypothetical protein